MAHSQSLEDVVFEPLQVKAADAIVSDVDAGLDSLERSRKRRRIEEVGRAYLDGKNPVIRSVALKGPFDAPWINPWSVKAKSLSRITHNTSISKKVKGERAIKETPRVRLPIHRVAWPQTQIKSHYNVQKATRSATSKDQVLGGTLGAACTNGEQHENEEDKPRRKQGDREENAQQSIDWSFGAATSIALGIPVQGNEAVLGRVSCDHAPRPGPSRPGSSTQFSSPITKHLHSSTTEDSCDSTQAAVRSAYRFFRNALDISFQQDPSQSSSSLPVNSNGLPKQVHHSEPQHLIPGYSRCYLPQVESTLDEFETKSMKERAFDENPKGPDYNIAEDCVPLKRAKFAPSPFPLSEMDFNKVSKIDLEPGRLKKAITGRRIATIQTPTMHKARVSAQPIQSQKSALKRTALKPMSFSATGFSQDERAGCSVDLMEGKCSDEVDLECILNDAAVFLEDWTVESELKKAVN